MADQKPPIVVHDPFKDSAWRFLGYTNEVGEAFRPLIPAPLVWATYAVAVGYAIGDTYHKTDLTYKEIHDWVKAADKGAETAIWQTLASVTIPPLFIHQVVSFTNRKLSTRMPPTRAASFASIAGLLAIPVIFKPIDYATDQFIHHVYHGVPWRQWVGIRPRRPVEID